MTVARGQRRGGVRTARTARMVAMLAAGSLLAGLAAAIAAVAAPSVAAAATTSQVFSYTGGVQSYSVPSGVSALKVVVDGGAGGNGGYLDNQGEGGTGAAGGEVTAQVPVTPGEVLQVFVGGGGGSGHGLTGGAGGIGGDFTGGSGGNNYLTGLAGGGAGAASSVSATGTPLVVAGGGGGGGGEGLDLYSQTNYPGGNAGAGGSPPGSGIGGGNLNKGIGGAGGGNAGYQTGQTGGAGGGGLPGGNGGAGGTAFPQFQYGEGGGGGGAGASYTSGAVGQAVSGPANQGAQQNGTVIIIPAAPTVTTLTSSPDPSGAGNPVTFTATVSGTDGGGTVAFTDESNTGVYGTICAAQPVQNVGGSQQASCTTSSLSLGGYAVTAAYSGDAGSLASTSTVLQQYVNIASTPTTTAFISPPVNVPAGVPLDFTVAVSGSQGNGTVTWTAGGATQVCPGHFTYVNGQYEVTCTIQLSAVPGAETITASYSGATASGLQLQPSSAQVVVHLQGSPPDYLVVSPSSTSVAVNTAARFTAGYYNGYGTYQYDDTGSQWSISPDGSCTLNGSPNNAWETCTPTRPGPHSISATSYRSVCLDPNYQGNCPSSIGFYYPVGTASLLALGPLSRIGLTPAASTVLPGQPDLISAEGYDSAGDDLGPVTSPVTYSISPDGTCAANACTAAVAGNHTVTVASGVLTATTTFNAASTADAPGIFATTTAVTAEAVATLNQPITYEAAVVPDDGTNTNSARGVVQWLLDGNGVPGCTATNPLYTYGNKHICPVSISTPGVHAVSAVYSGDPQGTLPAALAPSAATMYVTVLGPQNGINLIPATTTSTAGQPISYSATAVDAANDSLGADTNVTLAIAPDGTCSGTTCTPARSGQHTVTARDGAFTAAASLTATTGPVASLTLNPATATISLTASQTFTAEGFDAAGDDLGSFTNAATFSIAPDGSCLAATCKARVPGAHTVTATAGTGTGTATLTIPATVPGPPTAVAAVAGDGQATVSFTAPASDGGAAVSAYTVTALDVTRPGGGGETVSGPASPLTVGGLSDGDSYTFSVVATNALGAGGSSAPSAPVTPLAPATTLSIAGPTSPTVGHSVMYTATVSPTPDGGTMTFTDTAGWISGCAGLGVDPSTGSASCSVLFRTSGPDTITAAYSGSVHHGMSSSNLLVGVLPIPQVITFQSDAPTSATIGDSYAPRATGGGSTNPVVFSIDPSSTRICSLANGLVLFKAAGSCRIDAVQAGNGRYSRGGAQHVVTVAKVPSTLAAQVIVDTRYHLQLSATLTLQGKPLASQPVVFVAGGQTICVATTAASGTALCVAGAGPAATVAKAGFTASFAGTPLDASAQVVVPAVSSGP